MRRKRGRDGDHPTLHRFQCHAGLKALFIVKEWPSHNTIQTTAVDTNKPLKAPNTGSQHKPNPDEIALICLTHWQEQAINTYRKKPLYI